MLTLSSSQHGFTKGKRSLYYPCLVIRDARLEVLEKLGLICGRAQLLCCSILVVRSICGRAVGSLLGAPGSELFTWEGENFGTRNHSVETFCGCEQDAIKSIISYGHLQNRLEMRTLSNEQFRLCKRLCWVLIMAVLINSHG